MDTLHRLHGRLSGTQHARRAAPRVSLSLRHRSTFEPLEQRHLMAADLRTIDGTLNNLAQPDWGSAGQDLLRIAPAEYSDGTSSPAGADRPSARTISNELAAETSEVTSDRNLAAMVYAWGQFIDHDIDLTTTSAAEAYPVDVPQWDSYFDPTGTGTAQIYLSRSIYDPATGTSTSNPRQQINTITAFLDGSVIYGSTPEVAASCAPGSADV